MGEEQAPLPEPLTSALRSRARSRPLRAGKAGCLGQALTAASLRAGPDYPQKGKFALLGAREWRFNRPGTHPRKIALESSGVTRVWSVTKALWALFNPMASNALSSP